MKILQRLENLSTRALAKIILGALVVSMVATAAVEIAYAAKYQIQAKVIKPQSRVGVNPTTQSLDFGDVPQGGKGRRYITLENASSRSAFIVVWTSGAIGELTKVSKNYFTLKSKHRRKLEFSLKVPVSAQKAIYRGRVYIFRLPKLI